MLLEDLGLRFLYVLRMYAERWGEGERCKRRRSSRLLGRGRRWLLHGLAGRRMESHWEEMEVGRELRRGGQELRSCVTVSGNVRGGRLRAWR